MLSKSTFERDGFRSFTATHFTSRRAFDEQPAIRLNESRRLLS
ncbi:hypothetical protein E2C01_097862 [Portunus trituberculatus]|uniref:Uncharacterized protein n=1 Tax=Portunus trituberculatus TaxID=210409 RepID=A0A5B7K6Q2_PORTR|nr:hypothetical protein [Portunus trituberculatus]